MGPIVGPTEHRQLNMIKTNGRLKYTPASLPIMNPRVQRLGLLLLVFAACSTVSRETTTGQNRAGERAFTAEAFKSLAIHYDAFELMLDPYWGPPFRHGVATQRVPGTLLRAFEDGGGVVAPDSVLRCNNYDNPGCDSLRGSSLLTVDRIVDVDGRSVTLWLYDTEYFGEEHHINFSELLIKLVLFCEETCAVVSEEEGALSEG